MTEPPNLTTKEKVDDLFERYVNRMNLTNPQFYLFASFVREFMDLYHDLVTGPAMKKIDEVLEERSKF